MRSQRLDEQCRWQTEICLASCVKTLAFGFLLSVICISSTPAQERVRLMPQLGSDITAVAFSPDGRFVLTGAERADFTARLWDFATGLQVLSLEGHKEPVRAVAFSRDGRFVVTGSADDRTARLWDAATGKNVHSFDAHIGASPNIPVHVAYSPDGHFLLTGSDDLTGSGNQTLRLWDPVTGQKLRSFEGYAAGTDHTVVFSPDSRYILASSWGDETARLWDRVTGQELRSFKGHTSAAGPLAISSDGRYLLVGETMTK